MPPPAPIDPLRSNRLAVAAVAAVIVVAVASFGFLSQTSATTKAPNTSMAGLSVDRPFVRIEGTADTVRVTLEIDGQPGEAVTLEDLPKMIVVKNASPNSEVRVVVENLNDMGTVRCSIGVNVDEVLTTNSSEDTTTVCVGTLP